MFSNHSRNNKITEDRHLGKKARKQVPFLSTLHSMFKLSPVVQKLNIQELREETETKALQSQ